MSKGHYPGGSTIIRIEAPSGNSYQDLPNQTSYLDQLRELAAKKKKMKRCTDTIHIMQADENDRLRKKKKISFWKNNAEKSPPPKPNSEVETMETKLLKLTAMFQK
jgi:hypothetical protein